MAGRTTAWRPRAIASAAAVVVAVAVAGCGGAEGGGRVVQQQGGRSPDGSPAALTVRLGRPSQAAPGPGTHDLPGDGGGLGALHVPHGLDPTAPVPLVVLLHGAGGSGRPTIDLVRAATDAVGALVVAPDSQGATWDVLVGGWGPDVGRVDSALAHVLDRWTVDPERTAIAGFSDGASYALSLGLSNGDLFTHVIAFSPGFAAPDRRVGRPDIFVAHGTADAVLPIDRTSRRIVPRLRDEGYDVAWVEFEGGHAVPPEIAVEALRWFSAGPAG